MPIHTWQLRTNSLYIPAQQQTVVYNKHRFILDQCLLTWRLPPANLGVLEWIPGGAEERQIYISKKAGRRSL